MIKKQHPYILWLPSWYPNELEQYNGDFVQRHAKAASLHIRIIVIFFTQYGEKLKTGGRVVERNEGNLSELIVNIPFRPMGIRMLDRIVYNIAFYRYAKKILRNYFREKGCPSLVHVHVPVKAGGLALWIKKRFRIPYLVSEQASTYLKTAPDNFFRRHWFYRSQVKKIFSGAVAVTNVSHAIGEILRKLFPIKKFFVIHNVVDTDLFYPSAFKKPVFTYIHVSSLNDQKNVDGILRVFKRLASIKKDWQLILVGPFSREIQQYVILNKLDGLIQLVGEIPYTEVAKHMQQAHVKVLFSKHENFPCVVVEALCCGLPVVASDVAGIKEAVNESNGILVTSENEDELLSALQKVRQTYGSYDPKSIASDAATQYGYRTISEKFKELYEQAFRAAK